MTEKTFEVKVQVTDLLELLKKARAHESLARCIDVFADVPGTDEVTITVTGPDTDK